jgi:hypothetical protein
MFDVEKEQRRHNRRLAKKRVQWLIEALCFVSRSMLADFFAKRQTVSGLYDYSLNIKLPEKNVQTNQLSTF